MRRSRPLVVALLLASCTSNGLLGSDRAGPAPAQLEGTWILVNGQSPDDYHYQKWEFDGSDFSVEDPMWTAVLCEDDHMAAESAFKDALEASEAAELTNDQLRLIGGGGQLVFDRDDAVE